MLKNKYNNKIQFIIHKEGKTFSYFLCNIHLIIKINKIRFILIELKLNIKKPKNILSHKIISSLIVNKELIN